MSSHEKIDELASSLEKVQLEDSDKVKQSLSQKARSKNVDNLSCKTGLVYDNRMAEYRCVHTHPERPERVTRIFQKLLDDKLVERCHLIKPRFAIKEEILLKHTERHFDFIASIIDNTSEDLEILSERFDSIYFHKNVPESALLSAGCTLELVEQILQGKIKNGAAVVRPPGHHALQDKSMGFCHFNNVAIAAMMAVEKYKLSKVLIVDWDVHYGNATHQMFDDDPRIFYFSLHRYDDCQFWPNLKEANFDAVGKGEGIGYNMHVAWNRGKVKDSSYLFAFDTLLIPVIKDYKPELILVSAGFDSGMGDPLGMCNVTPIGYAHMTKKLMQFADGKVAVVLEGGYNLKTISNSMALCVATLLGDEVPSLKFSDKEKPHKKSLQSITNTFFTHLPYWTNALTPFKQNFEDLRNSFEEETEEVNSESSSSGEEDSLDLLKNQESTTWTFNGVLDSCID